MGFDDSIMLNVQLASVLALLFFYSLFFVLGAWFGRDKREHASVERHLLVSRSVPLTLAVLTMTATWVGGGYINGTAEAVFDPARGLVWAQAPWGYALSLILGGLFFAAKARRQGFTTLLDIFDHRYGARFSAGLFLVALCGEVFWSSAILAALGTALSTLLGLDLTWAVLLSAGVAVGYTMIGGLRSVIYTDAFQLLLIFGGLGLAIPFALERVGGWSTMVDAYRAQFSSTARFVPPLEAWQGIGQWGYSGWTWTDGALLLIFGGIPWQVYFQRVLASRDERTAVRLSVAAGLLCLVMAVPAGILGVVGATADWSQVNAGTPPAGPLALPAVLRFLTPPLVAALGLAAVAAAVMSSVDSSFLSVSSMFAWNVYGRLLNPSAGQPQVLRMVRLGTLATGTMAALLALAVQSVYTLWFLCADLVYVILFPQLVMALYYKGATREGAFWGALVGLLLRICGGEPLLGVPALIPFPLQGPGGEVQFPFRTFAMLASLVTIWVVSRLTTTGSRAAAVEEQHG